MNVRTLSGVKGAMRIVALCLAYVIFPASGELTRDLVHLIATGHTEHESGSAHAEHAEHDGAEHGCSGPYHACVCHQTVAFAPPAVAPGAVAPSMCVVVVDQTAAPGPSGVRGSLFRPPRG